MLSDSLRKFVDENRPKELFWAVDVIKNLAEKAGLEIMDEFDQDEELMLQSGQFAVVSWGELIAHPKPKKKILLGRFFGSGEQTRAREYLVFEKDAKVVWNSSVKGDKVFYRPHISVESLGWRGTAPSASEALFKVAGISTVEVQLPEPAVVLPRAPWDKSYSYDYDGIVEDTLTCFQSEAVVHVKPFLERLAGLIGIELDINES